MNKTHSLEPIEIALPVHLAVGKKKLSIVAIVDTGASSTAIDYDIAKKLGMKIQKKGHAGLVRGLITVYRGKIDSLSFTSGGGGLCKVGPIRIDIARFGHGLNMLIGSDILNLLNAKINFTKNDVFMRCSNPDDLVSTLALGRFLGAW